MDLFRNWKTSWENRGRRQGMVALIILALACADTGQDFAEDQSSRMAPDQGFLETMLTEAATGAAERRVAFVLGNGEYSEEIGPLRNPIADAEAMAQRLQFLGFEVFLATNATQEDTQRSFKRVQDALEDADIGLFFYAGHGVQVEDRNYAVAVDAEVNLNSLQGLVPIELIVQGFRQSAKSSIIILDACRTTPWTESGAAGLSIGTTGRSLARGGRILVEETDAGDAGVYLAYATSPNSIAADGTGIHSPFSEALLEYLGRPGHSLGRVMALVNNRVGEATNWSQTPWTRSSLPATVFLNGRQTLEDMVVTAENLATESRNLSARGEFHDALVAALKGLPPSLKDEDLTGTFRAVHDALYNALRQRPIVLPLKGQQIVNSGGDGRYVLTASVAGLPGRRITVWSAATGQELAVIGRGGSDGTIARWALSKDSEILATISGDGRIELWATASGRLLRGWSGHPPHTMNSFLGNIAFGSSDSYLVSVGVGDPVKLWKTQNGSLIQTYSLNPEESRTPTSRFTDLSSNLIYPRISSDGRMVAAGTFTKIILWSLESGELHKELLLPEAFSMANMHTSTWFGFDRAGKRVAGFSFKKVWLWSAQTGKLLYEWPYDDFVQEASISPDGRIVAVRTAASGWEYRSGDTGEILVTPPVQDTLARRLIVSPSGEVLGEVDGPDFISWEKNPIGQQMIAMALAELNDDQRAGLARERLRYWPLSDVGSR